MLEAIEDPTGRCDDETEFWGDDDLGDEVGESSFPVSSLKSFSMACFRRDTAEV